MAEKFSLDGITVRDLCRLNDTDPPLNFEEDLGLPPTKYSPTYVTPHVDRTTYWGPGGVQ